MRALLSGTLTVAIAMSAYGADAPRSYADARGVWEKHKDTVEYETYASEFAQFSNHFHIDERMAAMPLVRDL